VDPDYLRCCDGSTRHVAAVLSGVGVQEMARMVKVVYVAGPYSAPDSWHREQNIRAAEEVATEIMSWRWCGDPVAVICVHTMARYWYGYIEEAEAIAADMELLRRSDAVVLVAGWQWSKGTQAEIREAAFAGKPIYESVEALYSDNPSQPDSLIARFDEPAEVPF